MHVQIYLDMLVLLSHLQLLLVVLMVISLIQLELVHNVLLIKHLPVHQIQ